MRGPVTDPSRPGVLFRIPVAAGATARSARGILRRLTVIDPRRMVSGYPVLCGLGLAVLASLPGCQPVVGPVARDPVVARPVDKPDRPAPPPTRPGPPPAWLALPVDKPAIRKPGSREPGSREAGSREASLPGQGQSVPALAAAASLSMRDPDELIGLEPARTVDILGPPNAETKDSVSRIWDYRGEACELRLTLLLNVETATWQTAFHQTIPGEKDTGLTPAACLSSIIADHDRN